MRGYVRLSDIENCDGEECLHVGLWISKPKIAQPMCLERERKSISTKKQIVSRVHLSHFNAIRLTEPNAYHPEETLSKFFGDRDKRCQTWGPSEVLGVSLAPQRYDVKGAI